MDNPWSKTKYPNKLFGTIVLRIHFLEYFIRALGIPIWTVSSLLLSPPARAQDGSCELHHQAY